jgi:hypothetical protein
MANPYEALPPTSFWKTGVAEAVPKGIEGLWQPKFPITRGDRIITLGSCFAQHISQSLKEHGFNWLDAEPAPAGLSVEAQAAQGYGVFSFRTGNIYTVALLKQWMLWATGKAEQSKEVFCDDGRYYDPFRPSVTADGFATSEQMWADRQRTLEAILQAIKEANIFIFTMGLTEAWRNKNGSVYPMCPGTLRGSFLPGEHYFHNYTYPEIESDLAQTMDELRSINPSLRFLLTVSPVPLTATASKEHVLAATTYSKSVLRAVAGRLAQVRDDTDYFPSYELITAPAFGGRFFEKNLRSVKAEGVAFVMEHFFKGIQAHLGVNSRLEKPMDGNSPENELGETEKVKDICDEIILETWLNKSADTSRPPPNILLLGDSQMGMLGKALDLQGIPYAGGAIMHGSEWHLNQFKLREDMTFKAISDEAENRWAESFRLVHANGVQAPSDVWIITNIGMHANSLLSTDIGMFAAMSNETGQYSVNTESVIKYLNASRHNHFELLKRLMREKYKIIWVSDFNGQLGGFRQLQKFIEKILADNFEKLGVQTFAAEEWVESRGGMVPEFHSTEIDNETGSPDLAHGSPQYYEQLSRAIFQKFNIDPHPNIAG